jgi:hypothetical protein
MSARVPPRFALWLLKRWGSHYHGESLAGDLIEQYQEGRSRAWCWGQVTVGIAIARTRFIRALPWADAGRVLSRLIGETAAVLALASMMAFGAIALGAGTLAWAATTHRDACLTAACVRANN